jgi:hypothetical protein
MAVAEERWISSRRPRDEEERKDEGKGGEPEG